jgi:hypothetical protein
MKWRYLAALVLATACGTPDSSTPRSTEREVHDSLYPAPLKTDNRVRGGLVPRSSDGGFTSYVEEGATIRVRWTLPFAPDSQRLTVKDMVSNALYANAKITRTHRTAKFTAPMDRRVDIRLKAYKTGTLTKELAGMYLVGDGELIPPPDSVPGDTAPPPPPDTVVTPPPIANDTLVTEHVDLSLQACTRQYQIGTNLQVALDTVKRGDCIRLPAGATYTGNFKLRAKPGTDWIQIYSYAAFPDDGIRFQPTKYPNVATIKGVSVAPALSNDAHPDASYYRIMGVRFTHPDTIPMVYAIVDFNNHAATAVGQIPRSIILDRVWVQGGSKTEVQRCVAINIRHGAVVNSWLEGCHHTGADAQAIIVWNGPGPFAFNNNRMEGSGENIMIGGADPKIQGLVPTNIQMCRNHIIKPIEWKTIATHPNGKLWMVKNLVETKNVRNWHICDNVIENNWLSGQTGFAFVLKSSNQSGRCPWCVAERVLIENNIVRNAPGFSNFKALDDYSAGQVVNGDTLGGGIGMNRITVRNNYGDQIGGTVAGDRRIFQLLGDSKDTTKTLRDIVIEGNVINGSPNNFMMFDGGPSLRLQMRNNFGFRGSYGVFGSGSGEGLNAWNTWTRNAVSSGNVLFNDKGQSIPGTYAPGFQIVNTRPTTMPGAVDTVALKQRLSGVVVPR